MMLEKLTLKRDLNETKRKLLTQVVDDFYSLFEIIDIVFTKLRILDPTLEEMESTEKAIRVLEKKWRCLQLSITPKCHTLFYHTMDQVKSHNGIADLVEDYVEHAHQTGKRLDHLVARINSQCFREKELMKIRRQWLTNDLLIQQQLEQVKVLSKRHMKDSPVMENPKRSKRKEVKMI